MSAKNLDKKGRLRSKIVAFRVSPEEGKVIDTLVQLSGLTKQDYILKRLEEKEIVVVGNPRVYRALKKELEKVLIELTRLSPEDAVPDELMEVISQIAKTLEGMKHEA